mmetsp:Transcript_117504/g.292969  ORF Transcript_117504/g.292969 Transcript_117504/m.292969 type:complete len:228 (+) Transcript_117504:79-762(+)
MSSGVAEQVIGAAAQNPAVQAGMTKAMREAVVASPPIQQAAWNAGVAAARDAANSGAISAAASGAASVAKKDVLEVKAYIQENHGSVKCFCFCIALALLASSIIGMINIFDAVFKPIQYLFAVYNMFFAVGIIIMDGKPEWYTRCFNVQVRLFSAVPFLASQVGRACFYFYVGSINLFMLPDNWFAKIVYIALGASLCLAGLSMIFSRCCRRALEMKAPSGGAGVNV